MYNEKAGFIIFVIDGLKNMWKYLIICFLFIAFSANRSTAQEILPRISVMNYNGKIIISWKNAYTVPVTNISIQRSFDSLKNYTTIGSVLNPQNEENGYSDNEPPYNKMYYRVFVAFEGGSYLISPVTRPVRSAGLEGTSDIPPGVDPRKDSAFQAPPVIKNSVFIPSQRIFTSKDNNVVIFLPNVLLKKYTILFFNDSNKKIFELTSLKDEYLIIEKVNFGKAGWFHLDDHW